MPQVSATTSELVDWVDTQLQAQGVDDEVGLLVLAAMEGDAQLDAFLADGAPERSEVHRSGATSTPGGTFLTSIEVEGFRGIGPTTALQLKPRPGLTIVAGRNGSGKSSLAEGLELVLTGDTYRWHSKPAMWSSRWRNLHHTKAQITIGAVEEDSGPVTITTSWPDDESELAGRATKTQRTVGGQVQAQQDGLGDLGWERPLEQFRPVLSYDELGGILEQGPSKLYDALASILGVEQISDALRRVQNALKTLKTPQVAAANRRRQLRDAAAQIVDERASEAAALLAKSTPDVTALRRLATGGDPTVSGPVGALRALGRVTAPTTASQVEQVAKAVRAGVAAVADAALGLSASEMGALRLLDSAIELHAKYGNMPCPVCRQGTLDDAWAHTSCELADQAKAQLDEHKRAVQICETAVRRLKEMVVPVPTVLHTSPVPEMQVVVDAVRSAWEDFVDRVPGTDSAAYLAAADHVERTIGPLLAAVDRLQVTATAEAERLDDLWRPLASQLATWCDEWDRVVAGKPAVDRLAKAEK
ncbi:MAG: AAA family ATPase, partial [Micrococcales bacterium]|nr:AAA family ATPase [Micrococcales bacterium]